MNYSDSERLAAYLEKIGYKSTENFKNADLIFFNTCSVKQKAEDKVFGQMNHMDALKEKNPRLLVGLTGCMVRKSSTQNSKDKDKLLEMLRTVDLVLKIDDMANLKNLLKELKKEKISDQITNKDYFDILPKYSSKFQAFIPIMTGCDNFCTYCIVPYTRGREKSRPMDEIIKEAKDLVKNGCLEITLLGQNVNSYGLSNLDKKNKLFKKSKKLPFVVLLEELNKIKGLKRLRIMSSHPKDMSDELIEALATLPKMCPYIHLPVQSGDNTVLKRMNRNYTREHYLDLIRKIRKKIPNCTLSTDVIVGFPGETKAKFGNTYKLFKEIEFDMAYPSQYSARKGTYSADNFKDDVSKSDKALRWHKINNLLKETSFKNNKKYKGKTVEVLVETCKKNKCFGKTREMKIVLFKGKKTLIGKIVKVKINSTKEWILEGIIHDKK